MQYGSRKVHSTQMSTEKVIENAHFSFKDVNTTFGDQGEGSAGVCVLDNTTETSPETSDEVGNA